MTALHDVFGVKAIGPTRMKRTLGEAANYVIKSFRDMGIEPPADSRLAKIRRVLSKGSIRPDDSRFSAACEAIRDIQLLEFIFDSIPALPKEDAFVLKLKTVLKDSVLPQQDLKQSKGRDTQFELFVAALCNASNLTPVAFEEPDITCRVNDARFGIAAKRIKTIRKLEARVRSAAKQIDRTGLPGVIALDTCLAFNPKNEFITIPIPDHEFGGLYRKAVRSVVEEYHSRIQEWVRERGVHGVVIHDYIVRWAGDGGWSLEGMTFGVSTAREDQRRNLEFESFRIAYTKGLPNLELV